MRYIQFIEFLNNKKKESLNECSVVFAPTVARDIGIPGKSYEFVFLKRQKQS